MLPNVTLHFSLFDVFLNVYTLNNNKFSPLKRGMPQRLRGDVNSGDKTVVDETPAMMVILIMKPMTTIETTLKHVAC